MSEFTKPEFLENASTNDFHKEMLTELPSNIDTSQGNHVYNLTRSSALIAAKICEFIAPEIIKLIFPEWSYGSFLDQHAKTRNIFRRAATAANGYITVTASKEITIPAGSLFATASINDEPSVFYQTLEEVTIPKDASVQVPIECTETGIVGNTQAGTIVLVASKLTNVSAVVNEEDITGGTEQEDDATLYARIDEYDRTQGESYVGNPADYKRWATSVDGVGEAIIISATDDSGIVTIILTDLNGDPATKNLCDSVYNYIMKPDDPYGRLAPVNSILVVKPPDTMPICIKATIELETGAFIEDVMAAFKSAVALYLPVALDDGEVKYTKITNILGDTPGVNDYKDVLIGAKVDGEVTYGTSNIPIKNIQLPVINDEDLILTAGTV